MITKITIKRTALKGKTNALMRGEMKNKQIGWDARIIHHLKFEILQNYKHLLHTDC